MVGKGHMAAGSTQIDHMVRNGNATAHKPNPPRDSAGDARNMVGNGKPSLGSRSPARNDHYQALPAATVKYT